MGYPNGSDTAILQSFSGAVGCSLTRSVALDPLGRPAMSVFSYHADAWWRWVRVPSGLQAGHSFSQGNGYGSIPINTIFRGMNIHLPAILMWTTGVQGFDTLPNQVLETVISEEFRPVCSNVVYWHILTMTVSLSTFWTHCHATNRTGTVSWVNLYWGGQSLTKNCFIFWRVSQVHIAHICWLCVFTSHCKSYMSISSLFLSISVPFCGAYPRWPFLYRARISLGSLSLCTSSSLDRSASGCQDCLVKWGYSWMV